MKKKTIIYIGGFILPDKNAAAHRVLSNCKLLTEQGFDVVLIGVTKNGIHKNILKTEKTINGFKCYEVNYPKTLLEWLFYETSISNIIKVIKANRARSFHSMIVYNLPSIQLFRLQLRYKSTGLKFIADCTEWYGGKQGNFIFNIFKKIDTTFRIKYLHFRCDGVICISNFLMSFYSKVNTVLLPPLIDHKESKWPTSTPSLSDTKEFTFIGSPGSTFEKETFNFFVELFSEIAKNFTFKINIVGVTRKEIERNSNKLMPDYLSKLDRLITYHGHIDNKKCIEIINNSHFFIFIRYTTLVTKAGFPTKFVESISAGTPVITNLTSDLAYYMRDPMFGFSIDQHDFNSSLAIITDCIKMDNIRILEMKDYCLKSRIFDYRNFSDRTESFMRNIGLKNILIP